ncbi:hypothetical protein KBZ21_11580 [Streptomyces sp. A73]|nr:hypothetical protein [Streptomyces sp. A73]
MSGDLEAPALYAGRPAGLVANAAPAADVITAILARARRAFPDPAQVPAARLLRRRRAGRSVREPRG